MLFDVVDQHAAAIDVREIGEHIENHSRAVVFIFQVRRVNQDLLIEFFGQLNVFQKHDRFVARVFVEADFADAQHAGQR